MKLSTAVLVGLAAVAIYLSQDVALEAYEGNMHAGGYDLQSLQSPVLTGGVFRLFVTLLETWPLGTLIFNKIKSDTGTEAVRRLAMTFEDAPTFYPLLEPSPAVRQRAEDAAVGFDVEKFADLSSRPRDTNDKFRLWTIEDYARAYRDGSATPLQVANNFLASWTASNDLLRTFVAVNRQSVVDAATESTERFKRAAPLSVFDGVPIAVKDELDVAGYPTTAGTSFAGTQVKDKDCWSVARLRAAGAVILGKTNMHEIGIGITGFNVNTGTARNPYNVSHHTGGSSSGSGAAVAAGFAPMALGADGGGSIRVPAAFCGAVGLKATYGRISGEGAFPLAWTVVHDGPIGASVRDVALTYALTAGSNPRDQTSHMQPPVHLSGFNDVDSLSDVRVGVFWPWFEDAQPDIVERSREVVRLLERKGAAVRNVTVPHLHAMSLAHVASIVGEFAVATDRYHAAHRTDYGLETRTGLAYGRTLSAVDYVSAQKVRTFAIKAFDSIFQEVDIMVTPATAILAPPISGNPEGETNNLRNSQVMRFMFPGNLVGHPAITLPIGYSADNLPYSIQVFGRHWEEHVVLRVANAIEAAQSARARPEVHFDLLS